MSTELIERSNLETRLVAEVAALRLRVAELPIVCAADFEAAAGFIKQVKECKEAIVAYFAPEIESVHKLHKSLLAKRDRLVKPLNEAEALVKRRALDWQREQEQSRRQLEAGAQEAARKVAEGERLRLAAEMEKEGKYELASAVLEMPISAPIVAIQTQVPEVSGVTIVESWDCEVMDWGLVPQEILASAISGSQTLQESVRQAIRRLVKVTGGQKEIPGVRIFKTNSMRVGKD